MKIKCDKCGKTNVQEIMLNKPEEKVWGMEDYSTRPRFVSVPAVMIYRQYALTCPDCGHRVEYTR